MAGQRNLSEIFTGVFLILVAICAFVLAWPLSSRTDIGVGPGFMPKALSGLLVLLGAALVAQGLRIQSPQASQPWRLRPVALVLGSVAFFGATIESFGLVVALTGLVLISCAANPEARLRETLALAAGTVVFAAILFLKGLGLQIPLWPTFLGVH